MAHGSEEQPWPPTPLSANRTLGHFHVGLIGFGGMVPILPFSQRLTGTLFARQRSPGFSAAPQGQAFLDQAFGARMRATGQVILQHPISDHID